MNNYGLSIGINHYAASSLSGLSTLKGAIRDATAVYEWMVGSGQVPAQNAVLITSVANPLTPNKSIVDTAIAELIQRVVANGGKADRLYFYFAGHGFAVELDSSDNAMCMADWSEIRRNATLSSNSYKTKFISEGLFEEVIMWLDCCRNTKVNITPGAHDGIMRWGNIVSPKWMLAYATQYENQAFESITDVGETRGIFTQVLLEGLSGAAARDGRPIDSSDLISHLFAEVPVRAQASGYTQRPDISHNINPYDPILFNTIR